MDQARKQAAVQLKGVSLTADALMGEPGQGWTSLSKIIDLATIALAAEQVGGCQQLLDMTVDYTSERVQFNRTIASYQAVKHKAADMMLQTEVARSAIYYAACVAQEALEGGPLAGSSVRRPASPSPIVPMPISQSPVTPCNCLEAWALRGSTTSICILNAQNPLSICWATVFFTVSAWLVCFWMREKNREIKF